MYAMRTYFFVNVSDIYVTYELSGYKRYVATLVCLFRVLLEIGRLMVDVGLRLPLMLARICKVVSDKINITYQVVCQLFTI